MKVLVTGAGGYLGSRVADALLRDDAPLAVTELWLCDLRAPPPRDDARVRCLAADIGQPHQAAALVQPDTGAVLHLAAVVSGEAERDFDLGLRVNLDGTRHLLEAVRHTAPGARFVFASSVAVFGGELPATVDEGTATTPRTSYGAAKAAAELLVCEYARRGFADGVALRLPTVSVRAGAANAAVTGFASGCVREPLHGAECVVPVPPDQELWVCSPRTVVANLLHAAALPRAALPAWRALCLPGLRVSVREMVAALRRAAGDAVADRVRYAPEPQVARMVASLPIQFNATRAASLGFHADAIRRHRPIVHAGRLWLNTDAVDYLSQSIHSFSQPRTTPFSCVNVQVVVDLDVLDIPTTTTSL